MRQETIDRDLAWWFGEAEGDLGARAQSYDGVGARDTTDIDPLPKKVVWACETYRAVKARLARMPRAHVRVLRARYIPLPPNVLEQLGATIVLRDSVGGIPLIVATRDEIARAARRQEVLADIDTRAKELLDAAILSYREAVRANDVAGLVVR